MNTSLYRSSGLLLLILCICFLTARSQTTATQRAQTSTVKGHTTLKGQPVAGIAICVRLLDSNTARRPAYRGRSDQEGNYRITNIPNGSYQVTLEAPEFWVADSLSNRVLILSDDETVDDVDFALVRGGVITGKVTTSGNRPLIAQPITLRSDKGEIQSATQTQFETDDRGIYRIFGLQPGKYRVSVRQQNAFMGQVTRFDETFYQAAADPTKAAFVEVTEGGEVTGIDITVEMNDDPRNRFSVNGKIVDGSNGQPLPNLRLRLQRVEEHVVFHLNLMADSDANGQFRFENLSPGKYAVWLYPQPNSNVRADNTNFVIVDKDITDLVVKAIRKGSVSGVVVLEGNQSKATLAQFGPMFLNAYVVTEEASSYGESARINTDGSFVMTGLMSGVADFSLGSIHGSGPPKGLSIARVERDGVVQSRGLEIKGEETITGIRIVLKYTNGTIRGVVKLTDSELPANAQIRVWLSTHQGEGAGSQTMRAVVDARGHFVIEGITDGTHEIEATVVMPGSQVGPLVAKQQVTVSAGSVTEVTLTVGPTPNP